MAYNNARRVDAGALLRAPLMAMQWRLLLLWLLFLLLPTAIVALPLWQALGGLLDHSVHAAAWARRLDGLAFGDLMRGMGEGGGWLHGAGLAATLLTLLLAPFLAGMAVAAGRAGRTLGFNQLVQCGVIEYGRMFRLALWSLLPYAVALGVAGVLFGVAHKHADRAVLESQADAARRAALWGSAVLFVLAHAVVESARAAFIADAGLRSATRALGRGFAQLLRRPLSTLLSYLLISAVAYAAAMAFGVGRVNTPPLGLGGFLLALLLTELAVAAVGWGRIARLFALAEVSRSLVASRRGGGLPPAL
ncbi:hypothetical protein [Fulvimonas soli]|jgi:hypothetical protein|uniref:Glycerophosphoryl diester phosphodiesterase family protein n=1 Tax=Fulvimonas soli TaxID=155197 RepID=A0A316IY53_9GAMM|nr:hypothetical protein [Fulvimonas soli]PWK92115.1 hypothetical protein C7456_103234 [Fulvimonas soli]TNY27844.1 hypothetical protein BV497_00945 [Fulvimonas soli]